MKSVIDLGRKYYWVGILTLYPFWFMSPVLFSRNETTITSYIDSDINGAYATARYLDQMTFPWSKNLMLNGPNGEVFWSLPSISQAIPNLIVWVFTRFLPAFPAVAAFIIVGWMFTGIMVYLLILKVGGTRNTALIGAFACEMLPWLRERVLAHTSYVWIGIPLLVIYVTLSFIDDFRFKNLILVVLALVGTAFFDIYWFWFSFWAVILLLLLNSKRVMCEIQQHGNILKYTISVSPVVLLTLGITIYQYVNRAMSSSGSSIRPLEIASRAAVDEYNGSVLRLLRPDYSHTIFPRLTGAIAPHDDVNYVGVIVFFLAILGFVHGFIRSNRHIKYVSVISIVFLALSIPTQVRISTLDVPTLVDAARFAMPGVRRFTRATMISEALACVALGYVLSVFFHKYKFRPTTEYSLLFVLLVLIALDLNPTSRRYINHDVLEWNLVNEVLQQTALPVVYAPSPQENRGYFPTHYLDASMVGNRADELWESEYLMHASRGESDFAAFLHSKGVTHLLVPRQDFQDGRLLYKWGTGPTVNLNLQDERLVYVAEADGERPAVLLEVKPNQFDVWCRECSPFEMQWTHVREDFFTFSSGLYNDVNQVSKDLSWSYAGENPTFRIKSQGKLKARYEITLDLIPAFGPKAPPQVLSVIYGGKHQVVSLSAGKRSQISIVVSEDNDITIRSHMPCPVANTIEPSSGDIRSLCFGLGSIEISQVPGS